jgi:hypothetical protein
MDLSKKTTQLLLAAAQQMHWQLPRQRDRQLIASGGQVLHAVDTDTVILYSNPWEMAPHTEQREGYAEIFPGEKRDIVIGLGMALAHFIFEKLSRSLPLVMLPPLDEEMNNVFETVAHKAEEKREKTLKNLDEIKLLIKKASQKEHDQAVRLLVEKADSIAQFLQGAEGPLTELRRYFLLMKNTRIASPDYLLQQGMITDPDICAALTPPASLADRFQFRLMCNDWFGRLKLVKSSAKGTEKIMTDAQALARLEWINNRLAAQTQPDKPVHRMVLITGDQSMHKAASNYKLDGQKWDFADCFLRHPRAYLAEPGVLEPLKEGGGLNATTETELQIDQWLETLLGKFYPGTDSFEEKLDTLLGDTKQASQYIQPLLEREDIIQEFENRWSEYTKNLVVNRTPSELELKLAKAQERRVIQDYQALVGDIEEAIHARIDTVWDQCFTVVADGSSYNLISSRDAEHRPRNAPMLTFDSFNETRCFVRHVLKGGMAANEWSDTIQRIKEKDDTSGYALYLALGVFFAAEGRWRVSAILASRALTIARRKKPTHVSGREALYLRAVSLRHTARHSADLEVVEQLLNEAEIAYRQDTDKRKELKAAPCRFHAELLALYLTHHLFRVFLNEPIPEEKSIPSLSSLLEQIETALTELDKSTEDKKVVLFVERNLVSNWLMACLLGIKDESLQPDMEMFNRYQKRLEKNIDPSNNDIPCSFYIELLRSVAAWCVETNSKERKKCQANVNNLLASDEYQYKEVMCYDKKRSEFLRNLVNKR